ncbi:unnamed protein product [Blepharisma stoltei]|uniref:Uncharacterized protein n=1 Tax=Blepharisma stoltei TaxID=1481888 RepID=A0AAU9IN55_9CILI|nr:unnamed protein product [Blepharisma stoltei]
MNKSFSSLATLSQNSSNFSKNLPRKFSSIEDCPLSNPNIGIISENDHKNHQCICELCSCGTHKCPAKLNDPYPISMYRSQYKNEFIKGQCAKTSPIRSAENTYSHYPITYETTNEKDFKPICKNPPKVSSKGYPTPPPQSNIFAQTSYSSSYLNWGTNNPYYVKQSRVQHNDERLRLSSSTSYKDSFKPANSNELLAAQQKNKEIKNLISMKTLKEREILIRESESKKEFKDFSKSSIIDKATKPDESLLKQKITDNHFMSTVKKDFYRTQTPIDFRKIRRQINLKLDKR